MKKLLILVPLFLISCSGVNIKAQAAWFDQPKGSRGAFMRCVYEVSEKQCGSSNVRNAAVKGCMTDILSAYRLLEEEQRSKWLADRGCSEERAKLNPEEL